MKAGERAVVIAAAEAEKAAGKREKLEALSPLWKSGATIGQIQEACGMKSVNATNVKIVIFAKNIPICFQSVPLMVEFQPKLNRRRLTSFLLCGLLGSLQRNARRRLAGARLLSLML